MKNIYLLILIVFSTIVWAADVKISQLPLGSAVSVGSTDSFPYVAVASNTTKRLTLYDLINIPAFTSTFAPIASPTFTGTVTAVTLLTTTASATTANITTGNLTTANVTTGNLTTANIVNLNVTGSSVFGNVSFGNVNASGVVSITDTTDSTSITTGSLKTLGGVGITKRLNVGGTINQLGTPASTPTGYTTFSGAIYPGANGTTDSDRKITIASNLYNGGNNPTRNATLSGGGIQSIARNSDANATISFLTNLTSDGATTNPTSAGFITGSRLWTIGQSGETGTQSINGALGVTQAIAVEGTVNRLGAIASTASGYTAFSGNLYPAMIGTADADRTLTMSANTYNSGNNPTRSTSLTGGQVQVRARTLDTNGAINFSTNILADGATTTPTSAGFITGARLWTIGQSGETATHTVRGGLSVSSGVIGNSLSATEGIVGNSLTVSSGVVAATLATSGDISASGNISAVGSVTGASMSTSGNINASGNIGAVGSIVGATLAASGNISASGAISAVGNISGASLTGTGLTSGSVPFISTGGLISQDASNFAYDSLNHRLGLLTTSPSTVIGIGGTASATIGMERATSGAGNALVLSPGGAQSGATDSAGGSLTLKSGLSTGTGLSNIIFQTYTPATSTASSDNTATTKMTLTGNGYLGIGTAAPAAPLVISGTKSATAAISSSVGTLFEINNMTFNDAITTGTAGNLVTQRIGSLTYVPTNAVTVTRAAALKINPIIANSSATMTTNVLLDIQSASLVTGSGTVGTGYGMSLAAPSGATNNYALTVTGSAGFGAVSDPGSNITVATSSVTQGALNQLELRSNRAAIVSGNAIGEIGFRSNDSSNAAPGINVAFIDGIAEATHTSSVLDTGLAFYTTQTLSTAERMRLTASGNLGLGTTTPNFKVHLSSASALPINEQYTNSTTGTTSTDGLLIGIDASGVGSVNQQEAQNFKILTSNSDRLTILASGTVGVNASSPTGLFFVDGSQDLIQATIQGHSTQTNDIFVVEKSDGTDLLEVTNVNGTKIRGTTTNDDAASGFVGEYLQTVNSGGAENMPATTVIGCDHSLTLTAGDWDITEILQVNENSATVTGAPDAWIGTASGNSSTGRLPGVNDAAATGVTTTNGAAAWIMNVPAYRVSISATTTYYLKCRIAYGAGTPTYNYRISARRMH